MKLFKLALLTFLTLLLTNCSLFISPQRTKEQLLAFHQREWEQFKLSGIVELQYKEFAFRKNISIQKEPDQMRIDIFNSGIFGLQPTPFLTAVWDTTLSVSPDELISFEPQFLPEISEIFAFKKHEEIILQKGSFTIEECEFVFSDQMKLSTIMLSEKYKIELYYEDFLKKIDIIEKNKIIGKIDFDEISL